jgi:hypothetical protein
MSKPLTFNEKLDRASARGQVVLSAVVGTRKELRRSTKPGDGARNRAINYALGRINGAMGEIRRLMGQLPHYEHALSKEESLRNVSQALQYERRQLKKMAAPR